MGCRIWSRAQRATISSPVVSSMLSTVTVTPRTWVWKGSVRLSAIMVCQPVICSALSYASRVAPRTSRQVVSFRWTPSGEGRRMSGQRVPEDTGDDVGGAGDRAGGAGQPAGRAAAGFWAAAHGPSCPPRSSRCSMTWTGGLVGADRRVRRPGGDSLDRARLQRAVHVAWRPASRGPDRAGRGIPHEAARLRGYRLVNR